MPLVFSPISYTQLNPKQRENFNFHKISAVLADYGFTTIRLSDDWLGADFVALHIDGETVLKAQLKGRLVFDKKYQNKNLYIAFYENTHWYLYPHDELLAVVLTKTNIAATRAWLDKGIYNYSTMTRQMERLLAPYRIVGTVQPIETTEAT